MALASEGHESFGYTKLPRISSSKSNAIQPNSIEQS
jgi:hypothetical protein